MNLKKLLLLLPMLALTACAAQQELTKENVALHDTIGIKAIENDNLKKEIHLLTEENTKLRINNDQLIAHIGIGHTYINDKKVYLVTVPFLHGKYKDIYLANGVENWLKEQAPTASKIILIGKSDDEKTTIMQREGAVFDYLVRSGYKPDTIEKSNGVVCTPDCIELPETNETRRVDIVLFL